MWSQACAVRLVGSANLVWQVLFEMTYMRLSSLRATAPLAVPPPGQGLNINEMELANRRDPD